MTKPDRVVKRKKLKNAIFELYQSGDLAFTFYEEMFENARFSLNPHETKALKKFLGV